MAGLAFAWGLFALDPGAWPGVSGAVVQSVLLLGNLVLTTRSRRTKQTVVRWLQRRVINPVVRSLLSVGINPLGLVLLETIGRSSGLPRCTPVGNGRTGDTVWVIAEHGADAGYVRNLVANPKVRIRLRVGWRLTWVDGLAEVLPEDDAVARQRRIVGWHPLRAFNAMNVRLLGTDLLTIRIRLVDPDADDLGAGPSLARAA